MLVASARACVGGNFYRDLASGNDASLADAALQPAHPLKQVIRCFCIVPVITTVVDLHGKTLLGSSRNRCFLRRFIGKNLPPARSRKSGVVFLWRFFQSAPFKKFAH